MFLPFLQFVDARTKWLDGALKQALDQGFTQVVCIAAGYDTRAYRFYRQGVQVGASERLLGSFPSSKVCG
jgi:O-methyltransferase involved in polyketide biosynthesis